MNRVTWLLLMLLLAGCAPTPPPALPWEVVDELTHDHTSFTQGLEMLDEHRLVESSGLYQGSSLRVVDVRTGKVVQQRRLAAGEFAEGATIVGDTVVQLTWREGIVHRWRVDDLSPIGHWRQTGEGWGICHDASTRSLWISDGSDTLTRRDRVTFAPLGQTTVTWRGAPLNQLNELECVGSHIWANVWHTDWIVRIDPVSGEIDGYLDLADLRAKVEHHLGRPLGLEQTLNGIAHDRASGDLYLTGKQWPFMYRIRIKEQH